MKTGKYLKYISPEDLILGKLNGRAQSNLKIRITWSYLKGSLVMFLFTEYAIYNREGVENEIRKISLSNYTTTPYF